MTAGAAAAAYASGIPPCADGPTCANFEQQYFHNMKSLQHKEFKKLKVNIMQSIVDQIRQFTEKFDSQINLAEQQINKSIIIH